MLTLEDWKVTPEKINAVVNRIVESARPSKIIIFGSAARLESEPRDLDILVVLRNEPENSRWESVRIRRDLKGIFMAMDVLVISEAQLERECRLQASVYGEAVRTGRVAYDLAA